jgi:hypothetical protein
VATFKWIEYECQNEKGELRSGKLEGFAAVIFRHEFRHLMSGTYLDHAQQFVDKEELDHNWKLENYLFLKRQTTTYHYSLKAIILEKHLKYTMGEKQIGNSFLGNLQRITQNNRLIINELNCSTTHISFTGNTL